MKMISPEDFRTENDAKAEEIAAALAALDAELEALGPMKSQLMERKKDLIAQRKQTEAEAKAEALRKEAEAKGKITEINHLLEAVKALLREEGVHNENLAEQVHSIYEKDEQERKRRLPGLMQEAFKDGYLLSARFPKNTAYRMDYWRSSLTYNRHFGKGAAVVHTGISSRYADINFD